jgi:hypothetical protein
VLAVRGRYFQNDERGTYLVPCARGLAARWTDERGGGRVRAVTVSGWVEFTTRALPRPAGCAGRRQRQRQRQRRAEGTGEGRALSRLASAANHVVCLLLLLPLVAGSTGALFLWVDPGQAKTSLNPGPAGGGVPGSGSTSRPAV